MNLGEDPELLSLFREEAAELQGRIARSLVALDRVDTASRWDTIRVIHRDVHTLKGSARTVGFDAIGDLCHALEDDLARWSEGGPTPEQLDVALALVEQLTDPSEAPDPPLEALEPPSRAAEQAQVRPKLEPAPAQPPQPAPPDTASDRQSIRVDTARLTALHGTVDEIVVQRLRSSRVVEVLEELRVELDTIRSQHERASSHEDRRETGALLARMARSLYGLARDTKSNHAREAALTIQLEEGLQGIRLVPVREWVEAFAPVVRRAARTAGVEVGLVVEAEGIQVDRLVLERLKEPLLHLLTNAVAHGIEPAEDRVSAGKNPRGTVKVRVTNTASTAVFAVLDDGRGVDADAVAEQASKTGWRGNADDLSGSELLDLICRPGFSTRSDADILAGRGVGMDVVLTGVQRMNGTLSLSTKATQGSTISVSVPLNVRTSQGLVLRVGPYTFGLPSQAVERVLRIRRDQIASLRGAAVYYHDGAALTLTSLADVSDAPAYAPDPGREVLSAVVVRHGGSRLTVLVDELVGAQPMVVRSLGPQYESIELFSGGAMQPDGSVLLVLDPAEMVRRAGHRRRTHRRVAAVPKPVARVRRVLVVDDSVTMRALERSLLEAAGFEVLTAVDGAEAMEALGAEAIDLVVTDLNMPRVNGFELCRWIRGGEHSAMPVLMVTSVSNAQERALGEQAGADGYITKGDFAEETFLAAIERLVS